MATSMERDYIADDIPGFLKKYRPDTCSRKLKIPSSSLKFFDEGFPVISVLEDPAGRSWRVFAEKIEEDKFLKFGWPNFVQDNNLEIGDNLTFSYIGNFKFFVKIYGKNGFMKNNLTANEELELHPIDEEHAQAIQEAALLAYQAFGGSLNSVVAISLFEVVMKKSDFLKMMFNIPAAFGNKYMKRGQKFEKVATLQIDSKSWQVVIRSYDRLKFRNGWLDFVRDNNLRVGDVLCFKLIDEENFIMKVLIRRNPSLNEV